MLKFIGAGKVKVEKVGEVEEGTLVYVVYQDRDDKTKLVFYEVYRDQAARDAHSSPELKAMMDVLGPAMDGESLLAACQPRSVQVARVLPVQGREAGIGP